MNRRGRLMCALAAFAGACGGPVQLIPGGELAGTVVAQPVEDWSFADDRFVDLETRPKDPYSVKLNYVVKDGQLYIDPAEGRTWFDHLRANPNVRIRFGDSIYPVTAVLVGKPGELAGFDADRYIYRLDSRKP
jgi:hypothetical protein